MLESGFNSNVVADNPSHSLVVLQEEDATVTVVHSKTKDARAICAEADILIAAIGKPEMVKADWVKPGAAVIDVGTNPIPVSLPRISISCQHERGVLTALNDGRAAAQSNLSCSPPFKHPEKQ